MFAAVFGIWLHLASSESSLVESQTFRLVPRTYLGNAYMPLDQFREVTKQRCSILCKKNGRSAFMFHADVSVCNCLNIAEESCTDYKGGIAMYIDQLVGTSIYNYQLVSVGNFNATWISSFSPDGRYRDETLLDNVVDNLVDLSNESPTTRIVDYEGIAFNWRTRILAICGGQEYIGSTTESSNCYLYPTITNQPYWGPWTGPIAMQNGRQQPKVVALGRKFYILGGISINGHSNVTEVLDTDVSEVKALLGLDGSPVTVDYLNDKRLFCALAIESSNSIVVMGGTGESGASKEVWMLNIDRKQWTQLPSLNDPRSYHGCSLVKRFGRDFIVVYGGNDGSYSLDTTEMYDLTTRAPSWTVHTDIPSGLSGNVLGSFFKKYDVDGCEGMILFDYGTMYTCTSNYYWSSVTFKTVNGQAAAVDIQLFYR